MKTLSILSQKGGTGKTNTAVNLAVASQLAGHPTALIDLDPQASAAKWGDRREGNAPDVFSAHASRLKETLYAAEQKGVTLAIIDTAPSTDPSLLNVAKSSDLALIPCRPGMFDSEAIQSTILITEMAQIPVRILFNAVRANSSLIDEAKSAVEVYNVPFAPCMLGDRVTFTRSVIYGMNAQEYEPTGKAASEVNALYKYVSKELEVL
ncbi:chromosome partitioning protein ParA [Candidatus Poribacteria bacterium]|nr:MAG: chromosome partitioning protein ParA [Candidatus Poribacteria bacterium]